MHLTASTYLVIVHIAFVSLASCQSKSKLTESGAREQALSFSLDAIENYFTNDCLSFLELMHSPINMIGEDEAVTVESVDNSICLSISKAVKIESMTVEDYKSIFKPMVMTVSEYQAFFDNPLPEPNHIEEGEFIFIGFIPQDANVSVSEYIWDDLFAFVVGKRNGNWKITTIGG